MKAAKTPASKAPVVASVDHQASHHPAPTKEHRAIPSEMDLDERLQRAEALGHKPSHFLKRYAQPAATPPDIHDAASHGVSGSGGPLPHLDRIQEAFGRHDVTGARAHVDGAAARACDEMGAGGFAFGNEVAFRGEPDLHTAAHEAAHLVQQRAGVMLKDDLGRAGDAYERHADAVADRVVQGRRAEDLLDPISGAGDAARNPKAVQADIGFEFQTFQQPWGFYEEKLDEDGNQILKKKNESETYAEADGWRVENDGGDIEVVVDRVEESGKGGEILSKIFSQIKQFFGMIVNQDRKEKRYIRKKQEEKGVFRGAGGIYSEFESSPTGMQLQVPGSEDKEKQQLKSKVEKLHLLVPQDVEKDLKAHPQVTAGIRLDRLLELFELLGHAGSSPDQDQESDLSPKQQLANQLGYYRREKPNRSPHTHQATIRESAEDVRADQTLFATFPRMQGFLTLVGSYIRGWRKYQEKYGSEKDSKPTRYAKNYTPIMSRTSLVSAYEATEPEARAQLASFLTSEEGRDGLKRILRTADFESPLIGPRFRSSLAGDFPEPESEEFESTIEALKNEFGEERATVESITVRKFIEGLVREKSPVDLASQDYGAQAMGVQKETDIGLSQADREKRLSSLKSPQREQERKFGAAVELRRLRDNVPLGEWEKFALAAFSLVQMINAESAEVAETDEQRSGTQVGEISGTSQGKKSREREETEAQGRSENPLGRPDHRS